MRNTTLSGRSRSLINHFEQSGRLYGNTNGKLRRDHDRSCTISSDRYCWCCIIYCFVLQSKTQPRSKGSLSFLSGKKRDPEEEFVKERVWKRTGSLQRINCGKRTSHTYLKEIQPSDVPHEVGRCRVSTAAPSIGIRPRA